MFTQTAITALLATSALAAPVQLTYDFPSEMPQPVELVQSKAVTGEQWTVQYAKRNCNKADTECEWRYLINTHKAGTDPYHCVYTVKGSPASKTDIVSPIDCEVFKVTQGYDPQGFTVIVPVHPATGRHIFAGFNDKEIANGKTAADKTFNVEVN